METIKNGSNGAASHKRANARHTLRKRGEPARLIMSALAKHPNATQSELAKITGMRKSHVSSVMARLRQAGAVPKRKGDKTPGYTPQSALAKLLPSNASTPTKSSAELRFVAVVHLIGIVRAEELLRQERAAIETALKGAEA